MVKTVSAFSDENKYCARIRCCGKFTFSFMSVCSCGRGAKELESLSVVSLMSVHPFPVVLSVVVRSEAAMWSDPSWLVLPGEETGALSQNAIHPVASCHGKPPNKGNKTKE